MMMTRSNQLGLPSVPLWPTTCTKEGNQGSWKPLQQGSKKREKKGPRRVGNPALSFGKFIRAHHQGCSVCYGRSSPFQLEHRTCPIHVADTEACKKAHGTKERTSANIWEANAEVSKDQLSKLMMVGTELAKEFQEIKRAWGPKPDKDNDKDNNKKGKGLWRRKGERGCRGKGHPGHQRPSAEPLQARGPARAVAW